MNSSCIASPPILQRSIVIRNEWINQIGDFHGIREVPTSSRKSTVAPVRVSLGSGNAALGKRLTAGVGERDGVIIVDHGSRRQASNLMLNEFVAMFRDRTGYSIVEPAHMELAKPSIKDAYTSCVQKGANRVIVSPFFLLPGRHWQQDIPSLAAEAAKDHPGVSYIVTAPLGLHELLVDVMDDRINHCLSHVAGEAGECAVCLGTGKCQMRRTAEV
uniref:Sirohydrochlorin ferrochelatase n=1 Tax=Kalanchoe fedtschenkoi TaxID=63787 RepID=A0A7N0VFB2_KALFE